MAVDTPSLAPVPRPLRRRRVRPLDALFHAGALAAVLIALAALAWLLVSVARSGIGALTWDFLTDPVSTRAERAGFASALRGSLVLMVITFVVAIPVGFAAAIHLEKFAAVDRAAGARVGPPLARLLEVAIANLAAVPSIIYGLLGLAVFVTFVGFAKSLLAGGLTLALLVLPIVIIASREAIRAVPASIEQGAMALGATRWQAVSRQVVPAALPGMMTGTILAMSRAIGESAPLIVVGGVAFGTRLPSLSPLEADDTPLFAMPLQIFDWTDRPQAAFHELAAAGILVLLGVLLVMNAAAIVIRNRFSRRW